MTAQLRHLELEIDRGELDSAIRSLQSITRNIEEAKGELAEDLVEPLCLYARALSKRDGWRTFGWAEECALRRALTIARSAHGESSDQVARIHRMLAVSLRAANRTVEANEHMRRVVAHCERTKREGPVLARALREHAEILFELRDASEALVVLERCAYMDSMTHGRDYALVQSLRGRALLSLGRNDEALVALNQAYVYWTNRYGERSRHAADLFDWIRRAKAPPPR